MTLRPKKGDISSRCPDSPPLSRSTPSDGNYYTSLFPVASELDSSGSYRDGSGSTLPMRGKLPTSGLNGHVHHAQQPHPHVHHAQQPHPHAQQRDEGEIQKLKAFVRHLQVY